jgi:hypothetical protein
MSTSEHFLNHSIDGPGGNTTVDVYQRHGHMACDSGKYPCTASFVFTEKTIAEILPGEMKTLSAQQALACSAQCLAECLLRQKGYLR